MIIHVKVLLMSYQHFSPTRYF